MAGIRVTLVETGQQMEAKLLVNRSNNKKIIAKLIITTEKTGYTCQHIYGEIRALPYPSIVVPTYKMILVRDETDEKGNTKSTTIENFNVTRDSWYSRGYITVDNLLKFILVNRAFEPADGNRNLYRTVPMDYNGIDAFALRQKRTEDTNLDEETRKIREAQLKAVPFTKEMNTYLNGKPIDDARKDLGIATGVMIHIAGWYFNEYLKENRLAGSYGCFGVIPKNQILETREEAEKWRKNKTYQKETSNNYYNNFLNKVISVRGSNPLHVLIKKRENVKKNETIIKS